MTARSDRLDVVLRLAALREQQAKFALAESLHRYTAKSEQLNRITDAVLTVRSMGVSDGSLGWWGLSKDLAEHRREWERECAMLEGEYLESADAYVEALNSEKMIRRIALRKRKAEQYRTERRDLLEMLEISLSVRGTWESRNDIG